jgi:5'-nucleotidase
MSPTTPIVLVTNDDGIDSPGLAVMARALAAHFEVIVAAPSVDMSGSGTGIGRFDMEAGVELTPRDIEGVPRAYSINGPPGLAVTAAALGAFGKVPDLVVSGINAGINTGHSVIHSGTVGAALTANTFKIRGLAVSLAHSDPWYWETAADAATGAARWMVSVRRRPFVLNLNAPGVPPDHVRGVRWADLDDIGYIRVATADVDDRRLQFVVGPRDNPSDVASDTFLCGNGNITLTPLASVEPFAFPAVDAADVCGITGDIHDRVGKP